jgi:enoyl-CoA hydratase
MLNRPAARNAQNRGLLVELGDAMLAAEADDAVAERGDGPGHHDTYSGYGGSRTGAEQRTLQEWHLPGESPRCRR